jgi:hypothetical protein
MLLKYRPEDKAAKKERLLNKAKAEAEGKTLETKKPIVVKYGINHVTYLIEQVPEITVVLNAYVSWKHACTVLVLWGDLLGLHAETNGVFVVIVLSTTNVSSTLTSWCILSQNVL